jgi:hypothetical protein
MRIELRGAGQCGCSTCVTKRVADEVVDAWTAALTARPSRRILARVTGGAEPPDPWSKERSE